MRAVQYAAYGGPEVLRVGDAEEPHAGQGQIRIRVLAAGVNPFDSKRRRGLLSKGQPLAAPVIPGVEAAGIVDEVGEGVGGTAVGDPVFGFTVGGATAEYAVLNLWAPQPRSLSYVQAAALPVVAETATRALRVVGVEAGHTVLIHGASGGVGQAAVQLAQELGARVIATASERNHDLLVQLRATPTTYGEGLVERVAALAAGGVDRVFDVAGSQLEDLITIAGTPEHVISIANDAAADHGVRVSGGRNRAHDALAQVSDLADQGRFSLRVVRTFDLADAAEAHRLAESGTVNGKIVIVIG